jgi:membrane fusion protein, multidrug efflux system
LRLVDPGNIVHTTDQSGLVVITERQPIAVVFAIPQDNLRDVQRQLNTGRRLPVDAFDRDLRTKLGAGTLSAIDSQIDPTTGTIKLKATFPNKDEALFPNQFVNARLLVNTVPHAIIVPSAAIQRGPQKTFVYVVTPGNTVESRDVAVSMTEDDQTAVAGGLSAGEAVVTDGVDRLRPGASVAVRFADPKPQQGSQ